MADFSVFADPFGALHQGEMNRIQTTLGEQEVAKGAFDAQMRQKRLTMNEELAAVGMPTGTDTTTAKADVPDTVTERGGPASPLNPPLYSRATDAPIWMMDLKAAGEAKRKEQIALKAGDYDLAKTYGTQAASNLAHAASAQKEHNETQQKNFAIMLDSVNGVSGPQDLNAMLYTLNRFQPGTIDNSLFQRDPITGQYLWDTTIQPGAPTNKQIVEVLKKNILLQKQQAEIDNKRSEIAHRTQEEIQAADKLAEEKRNHNMEDARARDKIRESASDRALRREEFNNNKVNSILQTEQKQLDASPEAKIFGKYTTGLSLAESIDEKLAAPNGYQNVTTADALALSKSFYNMIEGYRGRVGGRVEAGQLNAMNGVAQKLDKYISTLGEGDKILDVGVMKQATDTMKNLYLDANTQMLKKELSSFDTASQRVSRISSEGLTKSDMRMQGDLSRALKAGRAKVVPYQGKTYVIFGRNADDQFVLPDGFME